MGDNGRQWETTGDQETTAVRKKSSKYRGAKARVTTSDNERYWPCSRNRERMGPKTRGKGQGDHGIQRETMAVHKKSRGAKTQFSTKIAQNPQAPLVWGKVVGTSSRRVPKGKS